MTLIRQSLRRVSHPRYLLCPRLSFSQATSLPPPIEEEQAPTYDPKKYYAAHIGETVGRYTLISKLGWGASCTAWLAKDVSRWPWQSTKYVTLKITNLGDEEKKATEEEIAISQHIAALHSDHEGQEYVRLVKESFQVQGPLGQHTCLVFEPLREPLWLLGKHLRSVGVPPGVLRPFLRIILQGLDFLHSECHIIHTDLKADNFLIGFEDANVIKRYVRQQELNPAPHVFRDGRPIYHSRPDFGLLTKGTGVLRISDFSAAVFGNVTTPHNHDIQPLPFCAPEVLLKAGWTYSADIWNLGTVLWELFGDTTLFGGMSHESQLSREAHIAQMIRLLGPPPSEFLKKCDPYIRDDLFSAQGDFKFPHLIPPESFNFSNLVPVLQGEDKRLFIEFARKMLRWEPERRLTAKELYNDPWLHTSS